MCLKAKCGPVINAALFEIYDLADAYDRIFKPASALRRAMYEAIGGIIPGMTLNYEKACITINA